MFETNKRTSHTIWTALTTQCLWNAEMVLKRLVAGMTSVLVADVFIQRTCVCIQGIHFISRCVPWESNPQPWRYKWHALQIELQAKLLGRLRWSNTYFKTFVQRVLSTKHTGAERIVYSPTSLKQFEHCFIFLFTHPLHLSQSPHKNRMCLCQRVTRSVSLPAQVSSVISILVVMATQQQGGKWQPNLWHSCRPGQAWGPRGDFNHEPQDPAGSPSLQSKSFDLREKREYPNTLRYSFTEINVPDLCIKPDEALFKNSRMKRWTWSLAYASRNNWMIYNWHNKPSKWQSRDKEVISCLI